jgi:hypothetical protein
MTLVRQPAERVSETRLQPSAGASRQGLPRLVGAAVLVVLVAIIVGAYAARTPPAPRPASSPADQFSADRAFTHVEQVAAVPHPVGSAANAGVRNYLLAELRDLGLQPNVLTGTGIRDNEVAWVENSMREFPVGPAPVMSCWPRTTTPWPTHQAPVTTLPASPRSWKRPGRCAPPPRCATTLTW